MKAKSGPTNHYFKVDDMHISKNMKPIPNRKTGPTTQQVILTLPDIVLIKAKTAHILPHLSTNTT